MLFVDHNKIEDFIIESLHENPLTGPDLIKKIQRDRGGITKQAIYYSLRYLIGKKAVHKIKKKYHINIFWLRKIESFLMSHVKRNPENIGITKFKDGDKVTVTFKDMESADIYWASLFDTVYELSKKNQILFLYHPHEWMMIARRESEEYFFLRCEQEKRLHLVAIAGSTYLDKEFKKKYSKRFNKINTGINLGLKNNKYFSIIDDFIFEVTTTFDFAENIKEIYQNNSLSEGAVYLKLKLLLKKPSKTKLTITRSKQKAMALKKRIAKDFYMPDSYLL